MEDQPCVRASVMIRGLVQGVGFRAFAQSQAVCRGLKGWVRNLSDGRVEAEVEGERALVDAFIETLRRGPSVAHVEDVRIEWLAPNARDSAFDVIE